MKKITGIILLLMFVMAMYLTLSLIVPLPFPDWYKQMEKKQVDSIVAHDPFLKLTKTTIRYRDERDSLQHIIDSLKK